MKNPLNTEEGNDECPLCRLPVSGLETHIVHEHGMNKKGLSVFLEEVHLSKDNYLKRMVMRGLSMTFWIFVLLGMWSSVMYLASVSGVTLGINTGIFSTSMLGIGSVFIMNNELRND